MLMVRSLFRHRLVTRNDLSYPTPKKGTSARLSVRSRCQRKTEQSQPQTPRRLLNLSVLLIDEVVDGIGERPAADRLARYRRPRARRSVWSASFLGKFPGCKD